MRRVFLADVHLSPRHPARTARLVRFLEREAVRADELYILGDFFEYWIGSRHLEHEDYREALDALRSVVRRGVRVVFLCGNRDFYMRRFAKATGIEVVPGRKAIRLTAGSQTAYLCHGDYMEGRTDWGFLIQRLIRSRPLEFLWGMLPTRWQERGATYYRRLSESKKRKARPKAPHLGPHGLSVEALAAEFRRGAQVIVCGHVHQAAEWPNPVPGVPGTLYTLGDWEAGESFLVEEDGQWHLCPVPGTAPGGTEGVGGSPVSGAKKDSGRTGGHSTTV
ncbi:MAG TPA: metallophosphoesterase [Phycisphaerae bacterium]|nr:metallophosphoesterase [Phycisphaerae bacterium]